MQQENSLIEQRETSIYRENAKVNKWNIHLVYTEDYKICSVCCFFYSIAEAVLFLESCFSCSFYYRKRREKKVKQNQKKCLTMGKSMESNKSMNS